MKRVIVVGPGTAGKSTLAARPNGSLLHARCLLELTGAKRISARLRRIRRHGPPRPGTDEVLPTWDQALDAIGDEAEPWHVARFGDRFDAQGVLSGSKDASRCIGYLTKYLTKQVGDCHQAQTGARQAHAARLAEALRLQPCSPRCANWLRYGIQPKNARPGLVPGCCKGKAHDADHLGYAGRRVLVSRKWSGKTLADHRADRKEWLLSTLGVSATDPARYAWEPVAPTDPDHLEYSRRLLHAVADRARWRAALNKASCT